MTLVSRFLAHLRRLPSQLRHPIRSKPLRVKLMATVLVLSLIHI